MQHEPIPHITTWSAAPEYSIPNDPALLADSRHLWLAYPTLAEPRGEIYAVVRFDHVIEHRLWPVNDEGIGKHPYCKFGWTWYTFNEVIDSQEAIEWKALNARHWVITFKDNTLDVLAENAVVLIEAIQGDDSVSVLLSAMRVATAGAADGAA